MQDDLVFQSGQPQGFSTLTTTQWDGKPEPIVRELLQNCLDAADEIESEQAEVDFDIRQVPLDQVPGIESYRNHFEEAVAQRQAETQGRAEKRVIDRIRRILDKETVRLLVCRDNGVGLDRDRMRRILTQGNTSKDEGGAGAFGIGHLTAFAGSDLRYVLYAGRWGDDGGELHKIASGHAILASRALRNGEGGLGGDGFWLHGEEATLFHQSPYPDRAPPLLQEELDRLTDTGSVVCITGFNNFRSEADPVQAIAQVAAKNFLVAIWEGKMVVRVRGENEAETVVTRDTLGDILEHEKGKKRGAQTGRWLPGAQAYQAWQTLRDGVSFELRDGTPVRIRSLEARKGRPESRVQVFRNGMWITNSADALEPRHFRTCKPFAAVVMVADGRLAELVRDAEGPEHRHLERSRLSRQDSAELLARLKKIATELRQQAGEEEADDEFTPEGFVMLSGDVERKAEKVPSYRPRGSISENGATVVDRSDEEEESVDAPRRRGTRKKKRRQGAAPRQGRAVPGRLAYRASRNGAGTVDAVTVDWDPRGNALSAKDLLGVRVRVPSGSDQTCEQPLGPEWVPIREVRFEDGTKQRPKDNLLEVALPHTARKFVVLLDTTRPLDDPNVVEVDIVRRRSDSKTCSAP